MLKYPHRLENRQAVRQQSRTLEISRWKVRSHYNVVIMSAMACQITTLTIVYSTVYSGTHQRKHQSSASLTVLRGIHRWPVNSPHKGPVTRKRFPFYDVILPIFNPTNHRTPSDLHKVGFIKKWKWINWSKACPVKIIWNIPMYLSFVSSAGLI